MKVSKWGNSLAIRLPAVLVKALDLKEGDDVEVEVAGTRRLTFRRKTDAREFLARLRRYRGRLPADFKFDRLKVNNRG